MSAVVTPNPNEHLAASSRPNASCRNVALGGQRRWRSVAYRPIEALPIADTSVLELRPAQVEGFKLSVKRAIDIVFASIALILLFPLLALVAIAIKLDSPGPVLFRQRRHGLNGKPFSILKFRSMSVLEDGD